MTRGVALLRMGRNEESALALQQTLQRLRAPEAEHHSQACANLALGLVAALHPYCEAAGERLAQARAALAREPFTYSCLDDRATALERALCGACEVRI